MRSASFANLGVETSQPKLDSFWVLWKNNQNQIQKIGSKILSIRHLLDILEVGGFLLLNGFGIFFLLVLPRTSARVWSSSSDSAPDGAQLSEGGGGGKHSHAFTLISKKCIRWLHRLKTKSKLLEQCYQVLTQAS